MSKIIKETKSYRFLFLSQIDSIALRQVWIVPPASLLLGHYRRLILRSSSSLSLWRLFSPSFTLLFRRMSSVKIRISPVEMCLGFVVERESKLFESVAERGGAKRMGAVVLGGGGAPALAQRREAVEG